MSFILVCLFLFAMIPAGVFADENPAEEEKQLVPLEDSETVLIELDEEDTDAGDADSRILETEIPDEEIPIEEPEVSEEVLIEKNDTILDKNHFPDGNFRNAITEYLGLKGNNKLTEESAAAVEKANLALANQGLQLSYEGTGSDGKFEVEYLNHALPVKNTSKTIKIPVYFKDMYDTGKAPATLSLKVNIK